MTEKAVVDDDDDAGDGATIDVWMWKKTWKWGWMMVVVVVAQWRRTRGSRDRRRHFMAFCGVISAAHRPSFEMMTFCSFLDIR